jgi:hypothetical protein
VWFFRNRSDGNGHKFTAGHAKIHTLQSLHLAVIERFLDLYGLEHIFRKGVSRGVKCQWTNR